MNDALTLNAHAKINWLLRIHDRRPDGYHNIETIFQTISLHDTLVIRRAERFEFRCNDPGIPSDETNLIVRAARFMREAFGLPPVEVELTKRIPAGGGLGGGSSDAAAVIRGLVQLFGLDDRRSRELALRLGSDVPFFLVGGFTYASGRGEELRELPSTSEIPLLLAIPRERVSTVEAYRWVDELPRRASGQFGFDRARRIVFDGLLDHANELTNDFEAAVFARMPALATLSRKMLEGGAAWAGMSGSGSTIVGAFRDPAARDRAAAQLEGVVTTIRAGTV